MRELRSVLLAAMLAASAGWPAAAFAPDESKADRTVIRTAQKQIHSQIIAERVEGIKRLQDMPAQDAVKLIVPLGFTDPAEDVRRAAYETLLTWKDDRQVNIFLLKALEKESHTNKGGLTLVAPMIAVLLASESADTQQELGKFWMDIRRCRKTALPQSQSWPTNWESKQISNRLSRSRG